MKTRHVFIIILIFMLVVLKFFLTDSHKNDLITKNPLQEMTRAKETGKPVFLEFYSDE